MKRLPVFIFSSLLVVCITSFTDQAVILHDGSDHTVILHAGTGHTVIFPAGTGHTVIFPAGTDHAVILHPDIDQAVIHDTGTAHAVIPHAGPDPGLPPGNGFTIRGKVTGIHSGTIKLMARNIEDGKSRVIDSATILHDSFLLRGRLVHPQMMSLLIKPGNWTFQIFAENSDIQVSADTTGSEYYDYTKDGGSRWAVIKKKEILGSKSQDDWMKYQNDADQKKYDSLYAAIRAANAKDKDTAAINRRDELWDSLHQQEYNLKQDLIYAYARQNPSSIVGLCFFYDLFQYAPSLSLSKMDSTLRLFTGDVGSSAYYKILLDAVNKRKAVMPGSTAPDFTLRKRDSTFFTLSSTRGKYMLIDFWASWCHPCRAAIPHWKQVYEKYHTKGFDIVSVSDDNEWKLWCKAMDQEKMPWQQVVDEFPVKGLPARVGELYQTRFIPFYVLLDKEGKIILYTNDDELIDAKLKELLG